MDIVSIFPDYLAPLSLSLPGKAIESGLVDLRVHDLRRWTHDRHRTVDDTPYGGGAGMVMKPEPWGEALDELVPDAPVPDAPVPDAPVPAQLGRDDELQGNQAPDDRSQDDRALVGAPRLLVMTPSGRPFTQALAGELALERHLVIACGRYEGIDARVVEHARARMRVDEISIGDYVLNGGEAAALVITEAFVRLIPGVIGNPESLAEESHSAGHDGLLEYPVYTKPPSWRGLQVPDILFSGHHGEIARWRREQAVEKTRARRPDLLPAELREIIVGEATSSDAGELLTLQLAAGAADTSSVTLDDVLASLQGATVLVARQNGRLVGSARGEVVDGEVWSVGRPMVVPDLRNRGIGERLRAEIQRLAPATCQSMRIAPPDPAV
nr:tRNA (guanosine(37)-N1)-methyltransferase TrmD [Microlunatus panaciterrae]